MKKLLALLMAGVIVLSFAACGGKEEEETTEETTVEDVVGGEVEQETEVITEIVTNDEGETEIVTEIVTVEEEEESEESKTEADKPTQGQATAKDPSQWSNQEIIDFYKAAAKKGEANKVVCKEAMTLASLDGGDGIIGRLIGMVEPIAKSALAKNSNEFTGITGGYDKLAVSDCKTIKAYKSGKYTAVEFTLKEQVTGTKADSHEGTVGHAISVLGNVDDAISQLDGVTVDYSNGKISLTYKNPYVKVLIDENGNIVKGTWHHEVNVLLTKVEVGVAIISATLNGTKAVINYHVTMGGGF